ncbi:hypothetical protein N7457_004814 [Penicillium paradoxum]|uniref:uncharacterized protein n=1 Tax=Penicillium paradoxum TaxID=176176 RepID=UPI00254907C6|nr:uncharacterized protein N7457_004814 [Penicillium paradoxum]KAJ5783040.1 hypothetical protein N7457_004814 [Penicillium paradoxum]
MPDPAGLPAELFCTILDVALHKSNIQHLCSLALLNHRWHAALIGSIYDEWTYNGARQSFMTLLKFLRTVRHSARIAALIRTLNVGNWGVHPSAQSPIRLSLSETEWIRLAIHDIGLGELEDSIFQSLSQQDRRPLMTMLLASVPRLATLYACVPRLDPILDVILKRILLGDASSPLRELKELYLFAERLRYVETDGGSGYESSIDDTNILLPCFKLDYLWPVFYLPSIRTLLLYNLDPLKAAESLGQYNAEPGVENLYLVGYGPKGIFTVSNFQALISRTRKLKSFSIYNPGDCDLSELSNSYMWDCLRKHKNTLQAIDIYRADLMFRMGHFGLLCDFTSLEDLRIHIDMLLGGGIGSPLASFRLRETLPETLQRLTLYGEQGYLTVPDIPDQLQELLGGGFPKLKSITLEKVDSIAHSNGDMKEPYRKLEMLCIDNGIIFRIEQSDRLSRGNKREELWEKSIYVQGVQEANAHEEDEADYSDSEDEYGPYMSGTWKFHNVSFTDHRGATAHMVFGNLEAFPLPPLFSFAIYFTHSTVSAENTDLVGFFREIQACNEDRFDVRFDMYFIPSATHRDCVQHYQEEKASRGTYQAQVQMFKQADRDQVYPLPGRASNIPGMVGKYHNADQVLFICSDKDWREGQHALTMIKFGRSSTTESPTFTVIEDCPMTQESPSYDTNDPSQFIVEDGMYTWAHRHRYIFLDPWQKATSRGWKGW